VKLYADEEGHEAIRSLDVLVVSALARVEVPAALWRKHRIGELDPADTRVLVDEFEADFYGAKGDSTRFIVVGLLPVILDAAARLVAVHGVRAYDAVQLATALAARGADPDCDRFACFDASLRRAAAAQGFTLVP
jgi:predicted nucleic acid-binding protein